MVAQKDGGVGEVTWLRETKSWLWLAATVALLVLAIFILGRCSQNDRIAKQRHDLEVARATGKALDKVDAETPIIRNEQKEKEREVDQIPGSETRLPDGYGAELERVRKQRDRDPR